MTLDELEARLRGDAFVALDTNVMFGLRELGRLAIFQNYPTTKEWHAAKCHNAISHLGLLKKAAEIPGKHFPATVDWFIAGQARGRGWLLVTRDRGPEFAGLERIGCELLKDALQRLASAGSGPTL